MDKEEILRFIRELKTLVDIPDYVSHKKYLNLLNKFRKTYEELVFLKNKDILTEYCHKNNILVDDAFKFINVYANIESLMVNRNNDYIRKMLNTNKTYLDEILKDVDPNIILDNEQRKVVLSDEDYTLVIAGAGAGKTTTIAAKVKYLIEKKKIKPEEILIISFTNKAVLELKEKINKALNINCPITTFHATGYSILKKDSPKEPTVVSDAKIYYVIGDYFKEKIIKNESLLRTIILFFASYFDVDYMNDDDLVAFFQSLNNPYSTLKSELNDYHKEIINKRTNRNITIANELVRSREEVIIANYLYLHNIDYQYEPVYPYKLKNSNKPYTPDFIIKQNNLTFYLEHFGISENGNSSFFTPEKLEQYKKCINDKIRLHNIHHTNLIYTFSKYNDGKSIIEHLEDLLIKNGFVLKRKDDKEVMEHLLATEENRYIRKLISLICRFISNFKVNGYIYSDFDKMSRKTKNVRTQLFLKICSSCYLEYQKYLKENNMIDFCDMINESAKLLKEAKEKKNYLGFKYIIVDEYQDISKQRFDLTKALSDITEAKIMTVGDDWQSIYAFSGSDIELFTKFKEKMGYGELLKIENTYRNSQEIIDIAGNFVQKNHNQIKKTLKSPKTIKDPVIIYTYDSSYKKTYDNNKAGRNYNIAKALEYALDDIKKYDQEEHKNFRDEKILVLGRFGFDADHLEKTGLFEYRSKGKLKSLKYPYLNITFMTVHSSKGLGYDNVIVINGKNEMYGFPSKIEDDPVLDFVIKKDEGILYAEERRLFYVAMTRTKNRVFFIAPEANPSEFLLELKNDYKNIVLKGNWNDEVRNDKKYTCPICGYPLQRRYKYGLGMVLYICTNEPELCGFMTNNLKGEKMAILKCNMCQDGYLIVKENRNLHTFFLGCTNYKPNRSGCAKFISKRNYYRMHHYNYQENMVEHSPKKEYIDTFLDNEASMIQNILNCINQVSEKKFFGVTTYIQIFRGSNSKKIRENGLDLSPYFGLYHNISTKYLEQIIYYLIDKEYLFQTKGKYPVLHPTNKGLSSKI